MCKSGAPWRSATIAVPAGGAHEYFPVHFDEAGRAVQAANPVVTRRFESAWFQPLKPVK
jgi:hypothetical protein